MTRSLSFTIDEYQCRARAVQAEMARADIDVMLATTLAGVCWLSGIESVSPHKLWAVAVPREGMPKLFCQDFESHNAILSSWLEPEFTYPVDGGGAMESLARMLTSLGMSRTRIGMELSFCWSSLPVSDFLRLKELMPQAMFVDASDCVGRAMSIKSPAEIECVQRAGRIAVNGMNAAIAELRRADTITDNDIAAAAFEAMTRAGGEYSAYPVIVTTGTRSGVPHSTYHRTPIRAGDPVSEFAGVVNRYHAPMMRTAVIGEPDPKLRALADAATASVEAMLGAIRPNRPIVEVAAAGQAQLGSIDPAVVWHGYFGYSVGVGFPPEWSDCPYLLIRLDAPRDATLKPGMVFHLSTSLREIGVRGATCCETVLVTESGCEILTEGVRRGLIVV